MKTAKFITALAIVFIAGALINSCQKDTQLTEIPDTATPAGELKNTNATCVNCINLLANPVRYYTQSQFKEVTWGNGKHSKMVGIQYYNTESVFILRVKSSNGWSDLIINGVSSWTGGPVDPEVWAIDSLPLPPGWQECDDFNFTLQVVGNGPPAEFEVEYDLVSICPTVTDYDGNVYHTAQIGTQRWMLENLRTTHFNNGEPIPYPTEPADWIVLTTPGYCWYNNDITYKDPNGALYNFYAVNSGKLAPAGWHVATYNDWLTLRTYVGGVDKGFRLLETGTQHWPPPNAYATNQYGFSAVPTGGRSGSTGAFSSLPLWQALYWTSTLQPSNPNNVYVMFMTSGQYNNFGASFTGSMKQGYAVRLVKD
jgi:uncharacterized protein (TIGR02145 family)